VPIRCAASPTSAPPRFSEVTHDDSAACHSFRAFPSRATSTAARVLENLVKEYGSLRALGGVSFSIPSGEWIALMALPAPAKQPHQYSRRSIPPPPAASLSTDRTLHASNESELVRYRAEKSASFSSNFILCVSDGARKRHARAVFPLRHDESQAVEALKRVGLGDRLEHLPQTFGGESSVSHRSRLINQPKLILADEPTAISMKPTKKSSSTFSRAPQVRPHYSHGHARRGHRAQRRPPYRTDHGHVTLDTTCNFLEAPKLCPHGKPFPSSGCCTTLDSKACTP